ncbi:MAG TPA: hypothetical protein VID48_03955 [Solirubrobacteraceae bacterium]|jgi:membrane associated rhomboid family serine protease
MLTPKANVPNERFPSVTVIEIPARVLLGLLSAEQVSFWAAGLTSLVGGPGAVAYFAHVGGFLFGLALIGFLANRRRTGSPGTPVY